jgi:hypothetical protein
MNRTASPAAVVLSPLEEEEAPRSERRLVSRSGATVEIAEREGAERIEVRDAQSRLVFELDPATGRTVLSVPAGDLAIAAAGDIDLVAGGQVRCRAAERVSVEAGSGEGRSSLVLGSALAELVATRVETVADRIFEKARTVFRKVEDLHQLRAGRSRTVVEDGFYVQSGHTSIESSEEVKIDGKTIHLG